MSKGEIFIILTGNPEKDRSKIKDQIKDLESFKKMTPDKKIVQEKIDYLKNLLGDNK